MSGLLGHDDFSFAARLERKILLAVDGNNDETGLMEQLLGSGGGDNFHFIRGQIVAYRALLATMRTIARQMNNEEAGRFEVGAMN